MTEQDPLAQLRDIHLPDPVGFWPPAPGWWLLGLLLLLTLAGLLYMLHRFIDRNRYRRQALAQLNRITAQQISPSHTLQQINHLLKQTALASKPSIDIASLSGNEWLAFLDHSGNTTDFSQGAGQILKEGPYSPNLSEFNDSELQKLVQGWIKKHRIARSKG